MSNFEDVGEFHDKFGLRRTQKEDYPSFIPLDVQEFRLKFLKEELNELSEGYKEANLEKIADALVDLVYVALGTAHLHGLPWEELFAEVHRANMEKERCGINHLFKECREDAGCGSCVEVVGQDPKIGDVFCGKLKSEHSLRGSELDVIKPFSWTPPNIKGIISCE